MHPVAAHDLKGRLVLTHGGTKLGHLKDVVMDVDSSRVLQFIVSRGLILGGLDLLVGADEVIEIREDAIIVKDTLVGEGTPALA